MTQPRRYYESITAVQEAGSSSTTTREHAPGRVSRRDLETIRETYVQNIGPLTAPVAAMIERHLNAGMEPSVILYAIEETGFAPRPSAQYLRAILTRYANFGILTQNDVMEDANRRERDQREALEARWDSWYRGR